MVSIISIYSIRTICFYGFYFYCLFLMVIYADKVMYILLYYILYFHINYMVSIYGIYDDFTLSHT